MKPKAILLTIACAYCRHPIDIQLQDGIRIVNKNGRLDRQGQLCTAGCSQCGSTFSLHMTTKRKRKGRAQVAMEEARKAEHAAKIVARQTLNNTLAANLLEEPGCTCGAEIERRKACGYTRGMGDAADHALVHSWTYGLPNAPEHFYGCPRRAKGAA